MKHFLLSLLLALAALHSAPAQRLLTPTAQAAAAGGGGGGGTPAPPEYEAPVTAFADSVNRVFQYVDKTRVPSGILEDYGLQFIDHAPFTGTNGYTTANQVDLDRWRAIYGGLYGGRINDNSLDLRSLAGVNQVLNIYARDANVELPILHLDYHRFRPDAVSSGRLRKVRNRLYDVAGQNPYEARTAFAVAATATRLARASASFIFRPNLFFTNTANAVATIQTDFADGNGFVNMAWNTARPVAYPTAGPKDVRVRVSYTNGSTFESHLLVVAPAPVAQARYTGVVSRPDTTITAEKSYLGQFATATVSVEFGGRNKTTPDPAVLDKPLIVVKGFDVSSIITDLRRTTYADFVGTIFTNENRGILSDGADLDGYDLVYVDFDNGTDYIQRNAFLLETVIKWVNARKLAARSTQPNAMLAMSMGGLVAQYALRDIETDPANTARPHQVRLLITHDTPHQGANVPLGAQMAVRHLAGTTLRLPLGIDIRLVDLKPELGQARDALLSPAAQQMLRYQTTRQAGAPGYAGPVVAAQTSLYDAFQQTYQALLNAPTPRSYRMVASSNGSECGQGQPFGPYATLVSYVPNIELLDVSVFGAILVNVVTGLPTAVLGGTYYLRGDIRLNALPDQQQLEICKLVVRVEKTGGLFPVTSTLLDYRGYSLPSQLPLDSGSGGIIALSSYVQAGAVALPPGVLKQQQFCFVPTYSALNITPTGSAALRATYTPGTAVGTPFANFRTAARENEPHIQYTALNSTWMLRELRATPQVLSCAAFCAATPTISGPGVVCGPGNNFSVGGLPAGTTVSWSIASDVPVTLSSTTGPTTSLTYNGATRYGGGAATLQATISGECGQFTVARTVDAGGYINLTTNVATVYTNAILFTATAGVHSLNGQALTWRTDFVPLSGARYAVPFTVLNSTTIRVKVNSVASEGDVVVRATATDLCGYPVDVVTSVAVITQPVGQRAASPTAAPTAALYPNPATTTVDVQTTDATPTNPITVQLFDAYGRPRAEGRSTGAAQVRLGTEALPAGLYFVHLLRGSEVISRQQLRVEK